MCDLNQPHGAECFEMDGRPLGNQWIGLPIAACGPALISQVAAIKPPYAGFSGNADVVNG
ncbi:hypothetical protein [Pleomorphovibrio marinus]|uniref:hypothetical protein n=1 Tax=Pleomorphovibrio marinus TaxID=2164132 RepID=UPI0018E524C1|nr:hypothetical protein [Pleomorphovibrio marinus]